MPKIKTSLTLDEATIAGLEELGGGSREKSRVVGELVAHALAGPRDAFGSYTAEPMIGGYDIEAFRRELAGRILVAALSVADVDEPYSYAVKIADGLIAALGDPT